MKATTIKEILKKIEEAQHGCEIFAKGGNRYELERGFYYAILDYKLKGMYEPYVLNIADRRGFWLIEIEQIEAIASTL